MFFVCKVFYKLKKFLKIFCLYYFYRREIVVKVCVYFGWGSGLIFMSNFRCSGIEMLIYICSKIEYLGGCSYFEDVGIVCLNGIFIFNLVMIIYLSMFLFNKVIEF